MYFFQASVEHGCACVHYTTNKYENDSQKFGQLAIGQSNFLQLILFQFGRLAREQNVLIIVFARRDDDNANEAKYHSYYI